MTPLPLISLADLPQGRMIGAEPSADCWAYCDSAGPHRARGRLRLKDDHEEVDLVVPQPGRYQFDNAAMACVLAYELGVDLATAAEAIEHFPGVARRFQLAGVSDSGVRVIDDYAHNGAKIAAVIQAAQLQSDRLLVVFQPHGYGPARFLQPELRRLWPQILRSQDRLCYSEIYYAGGTVNSDISSAQLAMDLPPDMRCHFAEDHQAVLHWLANESSPGDTVLILGARDPQLSELAQAAVGLL